jgi:cytochrome c oxidase subunit 1
VLEAMLKLGNSLVAGKVAGNDPWGADTLEWSTTSPPPSYSYQYIPVVQGRHELWSRTSDAAVVTGLHVNIREMLSTTIHDAVPEHKYDMQGSSIIPFLVSLIVGAMFIGFMFTPWALPIGMAVLFVGFFAWFWSDSVEDRPPFVPKEENPTSGSAASGKPAEAAA